MQFDVIDKTVELEAIKKEYGPRYYLNEKAHQKAAELWGAPCNDCGVFANIDTEIIYERGMYRAEIHFSPTTKKYWLIGLSASTATGGYGYYPSAWDRQAFTSYHDARLYGVFKLQGYFSEASKNATPSQLQELKRLIAHLEAEKNPQIDLFDTGVPQP